MASKPMLDAPVTDSLLAGKKSVRGRRGKGGAKKRVGGIIDGSSGDPTDQLAGAGCDVSPCSHGGIEPKPELQPNRSLKVTPSDETSTMAPTSADELSSPDSALRDGDVEVAVQWPAPAVEELLRSEETKCVEAPSAIPVSPNVLQPSALSSPRATPVLEPSTPPTEANRQVLLMSPDAKPFKPQAHAVPALALNQCVPQSPVPRQPPGLEDVGPSKAFASPVPTQSPKAMFADPFSNHPWAASPMASMFVSPAPPGLPSPMPSMYGSPSISGLLSSSARSPASPFMQTPPPPGLQPPWEKSEPQQICLFSEITERQPAPEASGAHSMERAWALACQLPEDGPGAAGANGFSSSAPGFGTGASSAAVQTPPRGRAATVGALPAAVPSKLLHPCSPGKSSGKHPPSPFGSPCKTPERMAFSLMRSPKPDAKRRSVPSSPAPLPFTILEEGGSMFSFTHRRASSDSPWGIDFGMVNMTEDEGLTVKEIKVGGAMDAWNRQCLGGPQAGKALRKGDKIISANGKTTSADMLAAFKEGLLINIHVQRLEEVFGQGAAFAPPWVVETPWSTQPE